MPLLYDLVTGLYHTGIRLAAPFVPKARAWVDGRRGSWARLEAKREALQGCLWMHCASVGEFEQGRPVLEAIKAMYPDLPVLVTFYSPSGYNALRTYALATHVEYLPADSRANATRLLGVVRPRMAVFVKYDLWYHYLASLNKASVPTYLISAVFRPGQPFFRWYGGTHRKMARTFTHIFTQDEASCRLLEGIDVRSCSVTGDTRYDRVARIVEGNEELPIAAGFRGKGPMVVCGSTWPTDERLLRAANVKGKYMIVPHELDDTRIDTVEALFPKPLVRWSELEGGPAGPIATVLGPEPEATLVVDRMGLLARLYKYADVAYVGGGFGDGIHSLLEAVAWGVPVIFGPNHHKFIEARELIAAGAGFAVRDADELRGVLQDLLTDPDARSRAADAAREHLRSHTGATARIMQVLATVLHATR